MQNLPFLVTQNAPLQKPAATTNSQKVTEPGASFKQVLSKQIEQESTQGHPTKQSKSQKAQTHTPPQAKQQPEATTAQAAEQDLAGIKTTATDLLVGEDTASSTSVLSNAKIVLDDKLSAEAHPSEDATSATTQDANAALVASLQLPSNIASANASMVQTQETPVDATGLQVDQRTEALKQDKKILSSNEKSFNKDRPDIGQQSTEVGATGKNWLENVSPKINQATGSSEQINAKFSSKLTAESIVKLTQESTFPQTVAHVPTTVAQVATQLNSVQAQVGSANTINAYPGKTGWDQAISQKVVWMVGAAEQSATLTLNPPDLGPLQVVISVNNDKADTTFISENPEVRKALENGIPVLRGLMDQAGIQLGQANVSTGRQQQEFQQAAKEHSSQRTFANTPTQSTETPVTTRTTSRINNGLVDTFA